MSRCFGSRYQIQVGFLFFHLIPEDGIPWFFHAHRLQLAQDAVRCPFNYKLDGVKRTRTCSKHQFRPPASRLLSARSSIQSSPRADALQTDATPLLSQPILGPPQL